MRSLPDDDRPAVGLRERKKARTKALIQEQALRLFREQGYAATTVEQIAAAADISPSTYFRYFPTKEDVILQDEYDPAIVEAFKAQPAELSPIAALRGAIRAVFADLSAEEIERMQERLALVRSVPELRMRMLDEFARNVELIAGVVAERVGRDPGELPMRTFAGALVGAVQAALLAWAEDPDADYLALMDAAMAHVDAGVPL
jgi:AcrR family transcriptional regulator